MGKRNKIQSADSSKEIKTKKIEEEKEKESLDEELSELDEVEIESEENKEKINTKSRMSKVEKNIEILESNDNKTGVIYLGHLPWGFDEQGIKKYFEQFGKISRILVPRSKSVNILK
jgi:nucleolar protein 15